MQSGSSSFQYRYIISELVITLISLMDVLLYRQKYQKLSTRILGANSIPSTQSFQRSTYFQPIISFEPVWNDYSCRRRRFHCVLPPPIILNVDFGLEAIKHSEIDTGKGVTIHQTENDEKP